MNRGSDHYLMSVGTIPIASMRPRFMNRGSRGTKVDVRYSEFSFNEAPIHESGK